MMNAARQTLSSSKRQRAWRTEGCIVSMLASSSFAARRTCMPSSQVVVSKEIEQPSSEKGSNSTTSQLSRKSSSAGMSISAKAPCLDHALDGRQSSMKVRRTQHSRRSASLGQWNTPRVQSAHTQRPRLNAAGSQCPWLKQNLLHFMLFSNVKTWSTLSNSPYSWMCCLRIQFALT